MEKELDRLKSAGILNKVDHTERHAAPILLLPTKYSTIQDCRDHMVSVNPRLQFDQYPLPNSNELMAGAEI